MLTMLHHWLRVPRQGQTIVFFALATTVLMGALGLALDVGYDVGQRRAMQNAADTAALAGVKAISRKNSTTFPVLTTVQSIAQQNGVTDLATNFTCKFINDSGAIVGPNSGDCSDAVPSGYGITGVQVRAQERHQTFAMRALGISTSGTSANAAAQVQIVATINGGQVPFMPCGIDTKLASGGTFSILETRTVTTTQGNNTITETVTDEPARIRDSAFSYEWNGSASTLTLRSGTPNPLFLIHGPQIEPCNVSSNSWKGQNDTQSDITLPQVLDAGTGTRAGPTRNIAGVGGCAAEQSDNCIMILPVVDNTGPGGTGTNAQVRGRVWGAFFVTQDGSNQHNARLIKGYPMTSAGTIGWTISYTGPITVRLIR